MQDTVNNVTIQLPPRGNDKLFPNPFVLHFAFYIFHFSFCILQFAFGISLLALFLFCLAGCGSEHATPVGQTSAGAGAADRWHEELFHYAIENLNRLEEFAPQEMLPQVVDRLNQWAPYQEPLDDWQPDPLLATLSPPLAKLGVMQNLDQLRYTLFDAFWIRDVAAWACGSQPDDPTRARRLFDWTVRNVQLEPQLVIDGKPQGHLPQLPWETLLTGQGAPIDRAWLFLLLARQAGLDAALLGVPDAAHHGAVIPWTIGVRIEQEVYLFDPTLGLPIPAPDGIKVASGGPLEIRPATLSQLVAQDALLHKLDAGEKHPYPVQKSQLSQVVVLVEAAPTAVSKRMKLVQSRLAGQQKAVVAVAPSQQLARWKNLPHVHAVQLWSFPFDTWQSLEHLTETMMRLKTVPLLPFQTRMPIHAGRVDGEEKSVLVNALWKGRLLHLRGLFSGESSATFFYQATRPPNEELDEAVPQMAEQFFHSALAADPQRSTEELKAAAKQQAERQIVLLVVAKHDASYWLGLILFEKGNYAGAIDYFGRRTLAALPNSPWRYGASYNLARSYEASGDYRKAIELYRANAKQFGDTGQLLRATWLAESSGVHL